MRHPSDRENHSADTPAVESVELSRWLPLAPNVDPAVLAEVLAAMPAGLDPAEVEGFLNAAPNPNLIVDEKMVTVLEFLASEGDPEVVVRLASDMDYW